LVANAQGKAICSSFDPGLRSLRLRIGESRSLVHFYVLRRKIMRKAALLFIGSLLASAFASAQVNAAPPAGHALTTPFAAPATTATLNWQARNAKPMEQRATSPGAAFASTPAVRSTVGIPLIKNGSGPQIASAVASVSPPMQGPAAVGPQNYGYNPFGSGTNQSTIYHYTDSYLYPFTTAPYAATGWFYFTNYANSTFRCTATLIAPSIIITAGHCVHDGGGGSAYWIKSGWFAPAFYNYNYPYGWAYAVWVNTTGGWYNTGNIQAGYDVGIVVLNKRYGTSNQIGAYTGWQGYCYSGCLQAYWYLTQLGYPGNYYSGLYMTQGEHLETNRNNTDFYHGSGMQGGSSGGPHSANLGWISDSTSNKGLWPYRNYVFAVTSWGYISDIYKIQGASSLSGPSNSNNFPGIWNSACGVSRAWHGAASCSFL
jgi:V8-like Glu-specific endopeptidase